MSPCKLGEEEKDRDGSAQGSRAPAWEELWVVWCFGVTPAGTGLSAGPTRLVASSFLCRMGPWMGHLCCPLPSVLALCCTRPLC